MTSQMGRTVEGGPEANLVAREGGETGRAWRVEMAATEAARVEVEVGEAVGGAARARGWVRMARQVGVAENLVMREVAEAAGVMRVAMARQGVTAGAAAREGAGVEVE